MWIANSCHWQRRFSLSVPVATPLSLPDKTEKTVYASLISITAQLQLVHLYKVNHSVEEEPITCEYYGERAER